MIRKIIAVDEAVDRIACFSFSHDICPEAKLINPVPAAPTAAASVGVKTPR